MWTAFNPWLQGLDCFLFVRGNACTKIFSICPCMFPTGSSKTKNFQSLDSNCTGIAFYAKAAEATVTAEWNGAAGIRKPGTLCRGINCKDYFNCVSEKAGEHCISNGAPDKETCVGGESAWVSYSYCYLD